MTRLPQVLVNVPGVDKARADEDAVLAAAVAEAEAELGDTGRVLLRPSGTEPLVRVMVEAATADQAEASPTGSPTSYAAGSRSDPLTPISGGRADRRPLASSPVEINEVDPLDDGQVAAWHAVYERSQSHGRAFPSPWRLPEACGRPARPGTPASDRRLQRDRGRRPWSAPGRSGCRSSTTSRVPPWLSTPSLPCAAVGTAPRCWRTSSSAAVAEGRTLLNTETFYPGDAPADGAGHDNADFLTHRGYVFGLGDVHRRLELPAAPALLDRLASEAAPHHAAYQIAHLAWTGARRAGRVVRDDQRQPDDRGADRRGRARAGGRRRRRAARGGGTSSAAGTRALRRGRRRAPTAPWSRFTTVMTTVHEPGRGYQWGTVVDRAHRGHRLGIAVKVANLRALERTTRPCASSFTYNAEVNAHMVAINDAVGYRPGRAARGVPEAHLTAHHAQPPMATTACAAARSAPSGRGPCAAPGWRGERVGWMFCSRLGPLMVSQIRLGLGDRLVLGESAA